MSGEIIKVKQTAHYNESILIINTQPTILINWSVNHQIQRSTITLLRITHYVYLSLYFINPNNLPTMWIWKSLISNILSTGSTIFNKIILLFIKVLNYTYRINHNFNHMFLFCTQNTALLLPRSSFCRKF